MRAGADNGNNGTIFEITPSGTLTTLDSLGAAGYQPVAGLVQTTTGALYGTTFDGGTYGAGTVYGTAHVGIGDESIYSYGTVFRITPGGTPITLYSFCPL